MNPFEACLDEVIDSDVQPYIFNTGLGGGSQSLPLRRPMQSWGIGSADDPHSLTAPGRGMYHSTPAPSLLSGYGDRLAAQTARPPLERGYVQERYPSYLKGIECDSRSTPSPTSRSAPSPEVYGLHGSVMHSDLDRFLSEADRSPHRSAGRARSDKNYKTCC